jgi:hypothetical protein
MRINSHAPRIYAECETLVSRETTFTQRDNELSHSPGGSGAPCLRVQQVLDAEVHVPHDLPKQSFAEIALPVDWHSGPSSVVMNENGMATRLSIKHEATLLKD